MQMYEAVHRIAFGQIQLPNTGKGSCTLLKQILAYEQACPTLCHAECCLQVACRFGVKVHLRTQQTPTP